MTLDERIARYLSKCPPAVSGSDGHGQTFRIACALVNGFALTPEDAFRHLSAYNMSCCPPWTSRELRHKIVEAGKVNHAKPWGYLLGGGSGGGSRTIPQLVPVRLTPRKWRPGTLGTVFPEPYVYEKKNRDARCVSRIQEQPSQPSQDLDALIEVPGCVIGRPSEIVIADEDWLKAARSGLLDEPIVQLALHMFGPSCKVLAAGRKIA